MSFGLNGFGKLTTAGRIFLIFGLVLSLFFLTSVTLNYIHSTSAAAATNPTPAYAASPAYAWIGEGLWNNAKDRISGWWQRITCPTHLGCWVRNFIGGTGDAVSFGLGGFDSNTMKTAEAFPNGFGLLGAVGTGVNIVYSNPADIHLASFLKTELSDNLLASPVHATFGTALLEPIHLVWEVVRNITYALFIVIIAAIALMIILRKQLEARVVVTVTHALPKIFMALILITLSYPIAALFIDVCFLWLSVVIEKVFLTGSLKAQIDAIRAAMVVATGTVTQAAVAGAWGDLIRLLIVSIVFSIGTLFEGLAIVIVGPLMLIAAIFVVGFVFIQLLYRYTRLIILTVFSPLLLLLGALPGQEEAITNWFKDLAVNALVFPAVVVLLNISILVLSTSFLTPWESLRTDIPSLGEAFFSSGAQFIMPFVALIILLMSFKIPGLIEDAIKGGRRRR